METQDWLEKYSDYYYYDQCPRNSSADFVCEKQYRLKFGNREYMSKELYYVEKFTELYYEMSK